METENIGFFVQCLPESEYCRNLVYGTLDIIGSKWAVPVILMLQAKSRLRNSELKHYIGSISAKELAKQLRSLEEAGIIERKVYPTIPPKVEYWLSDLGRTLHPIVVGLAEWSAKNGEQVNINRIQFDKKSQAPDTYLRKIHRIE